MVVEATQQQEIELMKRGDMSVMSGKELLQQEYYSLEQSRDVSLCRRDQAMDDWSSNPTSESREELRKARGDLLKVSRRMSIVYMDMYRMGA